MKKISVMLVCVFVLLFSTVVFAGPTIDRIVKKGELVVGTSGDYPPFSAKGKDGNLIGLDIDLATAIASVMEVKLKVVDMPFKDLMPALQSGKIDIILSAMTIVPKRNLKVAFVGPYFVSGQSVMTTKAVAMSVDNLNDINKPDFTLAVPAGTTSEIVAKNNVPKAKLTVSKDMIEAMKLLLDGKVKAVMSDTATCAVETVRYKDKNIVATPPLTFEPFGIAIAENDPLFLNFLTNFISGIKGSGDLGMLTNKWFKDASWIKQLK